ncbi:hypothetical protein KQX54_004974 [Cotesia glomerata]|uniref:Uncharacterized protein n=1 Tax=Cotesia glomerata TaxID=32391 RepID=A0AAV7HUW1_COTGL|nr:hypothetical protein KQX54_004974 [Cotesia glomerata]
MTLSELTTIEYACQTNICENKKGWQSADSREESEAMESPSKFISGGRNPGQIPERAPSYISSFSQKSPRSISLAPAGLLCSKRGCKPGQRKSLRLTGSHGITGTEDIYASSARPDPDPDSGAASTAHSPSHVTSDRF